MRIFSAVALFCLGACVLWSVGRPAEVPFEKRTIDLGASETAAFADVNGDGRLDIVSGDYWYQGPEWTPHKFRELPYTSNYVDNFSDLMVDADGDGQIDVVGCSWFNHRVVWWKNPGRGKGAWKEEIIENGSPVEFSFLVDLDNDGKAREVLPQFGDSKFPLSWYEFRGGKWVRHVVSDQSYGHGIGAGDVNGDGRTDIITPKGWFEAPPDPRSGTWKFHGDFDLGDTGFIHVLDVNGDGRKDLVTSLAHNYGIFWMERGDGDKWTTHLIADSWSQAHSVVLADINGDGQPDLLTGKRYMAHNGHDPGEREPLGVYWYEYRKDAEGKIEWIRHVIDYSTRTGGGIQIATADIDGDGAVDFAVGGKSGLFLFHNLRLKPGKTAP